MFGDFNENSLVQNLSPITPFVRSLPADFFDPGVSKRLGEDGDDSDGGEDGRNGGTVKMDANSKPLGKSSAGETSHPNSKRRVKISIV